MGTFACPSECKELCATTKTKILDAVKSAKRKALASLVDLYPALTAKERELAAENAEKALEAYLLSHRAERLCSKLYPTSDTNDESDACRHLVWASLLQNSVGRDFAKRFLDAHESDPIQRENEKAMDLANNREGLLSSQKLIEQKNFSEENVISEFKKSLDGGSLIVIRRKFPETGRNAP